MLSVNRLIAEARRVTIGGQARYRYDLAQAAQALWELRIGKREFCDRMAVIVQEGLTRAWLQGAEQAGVGEDDLTEEERSRLQQYIQGQMTYVPDFADWLIWAGMKEHHSAPGGAPWETILLPRVPLSGVLSRVEMWANVYSVVLNEAMLLANKNGKSIWILGDTEEHCRDCQALNGRVYRNSTWEKWGVRPGSRALECHGYRCRCLLLPTRQPITRGRPPKLHG